MKNRIKISKIDLLDVDVVFTIGKKAFNKQMKKAKIDRRMDRDGYTVSSLSGSKLKIYIGCRKNIKNIYDAKALIVHEIVHAADFIMEHFGIDDIEFRAYVVQYLYVDFISFYDEYLYNQVLDNLSERSS